MVHYKSHNNTAEIGHHKSMHPVQVFLLFFVKQADTLSRKKLSAHYLEPYNASRLPS